MLGMRVSVIYYAFFSTAGQRLLDCHRPPTVIAIDPPLAEGENNQQQ